jgi:hypothetical protein
MIKSKTTRNNHITTKKNKDRYGFGERQEIQSQKEADKNTKPIKGNHMLQIQKYQASESIQSM